MSRATRILVLSLSALVLAYTGLGYALARTSTDNTYRSLGVFSEVIQKIQQDYVEDPDMPLVTRGALHGLLESLDPQSGYLSAREYDDYQKRMKSPGRGDIGVILTKRFGYMLVLATLPDSPAQKAGLATGDILEQISGFSTREMSIRQAQLLLQGEPGSIVKMAQVRRGSTESRDIEITRAVLSAPKLLADKVEDDVAYLRVTAFTPGRAAEIRQKLADFTRQNLHKLVIDLRDCASGDPQEAIATANLFVNAGTIATLKGQTVPPKEFPADPQKAVWAGPVNVLISTDTAGAAEILAAALVTDRGAQAVGEKTYGAASEQSVIPLEDGGALFLTTALYYDPTGKAISPDGVKPSVEVANTGEEMAEPDDDAQAPAQAPGRVGSFTLRVRDDAALRKAIELLRAPTPAKAAA